MSAVEVRFSTIFGSQNLHTDQILMKLQQQICIAARRFLLNWIIHLLQIEFFFLQENNFLRALLDIVFFALFRKNTKAVRKRSFQYRK